MEKRNKDIMKLLGILALGITLAASLSKDLNKVNSNKDDFEGIDSKELYFESNYSLGKDYKSSNRRKIDYSDFEFALNKSKKLLFENLLNFLSDKKLIHNKSEKEYESLIEGYGKELKNIFKYSDKKFKIFVDKKDLKGIVRLIESSLTEDFKEYLDNADRLLNDPDIEDTQKSIIKSTYPLVKKYLKVSLSIEKEIIKMLERSGVNISKYTNVIKKSNQILKGNI